MRRRLAGEINLSYLCTRNRGSLAQLVQSVCLTSRGSGVRIPQLPLNPKRRPLPKGWSSFSGCPADPVAPELRKTATSAPDIHAYPAILLRNRSPTDRAASSGNAGRKATPVRQTATRRNAGLGEIQVRRKRKPLCGRTQAFCIRTVRKPPYPHRYAPNKESSPPVKTINRYLRPQSFRPLPDRPFPAKNTYRRSPRTAWTPDRSTGRLRPSGSKSITEIPKRIIFSISGTLLPE